MSSRGGWPRGGSGVRPSSVCPSSPSIPEPGSTASAAAPSGGGVGLHGAGGESPVGAALPWELTRSGKPKWKASFAGSAVAVLHMCCCQKRLFGVREDFFFWLQNPVEGGLRRPRPSKRPGILASWSRKYPCAWKEFLRVLPSLIVNQFRRDEAVCAHI